MPYPPAAQETDAVDAMPAPTEHPDRHNAVAAAVNEIVAELGAGPKGGSADLTARLTALDATVAGVDADLTTAEAAIAANTAAIAARIAVAIVDAAGDLIVGTGPDAVARLAKGAALDVLRVNAAGNALEWAAPPAGVAGAVVVHEYEAGADAALKASTSTAIEDVDAANAAITFTPTGTSALIEVSAMIGNSTAGKYCYLALRNAGGTIAGTDMRVVFGAIFIRPYYVKKVTGLAAGVATTLKLGIATDSAATASLYTGPAYGPLVMKATSL